MGELKVGRIVAGVVSTNVYFVYDSDTKETVVIDPATNGLYDRLLGNGLLIKAILLTHGHFDHIWGVEELAKRSGAKVYALTAEAELCGNSYLNASDQTHRPCTVKCDVLVSDREIIEPAGIRFEVFATPGHTIGSCCYYVESEKWLFTGDTLFCGSIGRTDLPTGDGRAIYESVSMLVDHFEGDVKIYPGHGDISTIADEKKYNPFCS